MINHFFTLDPGISGSGIAEFNHGHLIWWKNIYGKGDTWVERATFISEELKKLNIKYLFIEWPTGRFMGARGTAAANSDAILKLCFFIGMVYSFTPYPVLVPVVKWKGQLKKELVRQRAETFFNKEGFKSHAADAVGIGQFIIESGLDKN